MLSLRKNKKTVSKKWILAVVAALIVIGGAVAYFIWSKHTSSTATTGKTRPANSIDYGPPSDAQKQAGEAQKNAIINQQNSGNQGQPTGEPQQNTSNFTITVTRAGQIDASQPVSVRVLVTGVSTGTCTFTFSQSGQANVVKTGDISYQATTASCGVDVPPSDFSAAGDWQLAVKATSGSAQATANQTVTVKK